MDLHAEMKRTTLRVILRCLFSGDGIEYADRLMTIFFAGNDTTSIAMTMTLRLLTDHPELRSAAEAEVDREVAGTIPTVAETAALAALLAGPAAL